MLGKTREIPLIFQQNETNSSENLQKSTVLSDPPDMNSKLNQIFDRLKLTTKKTHLQKSY